MKIKYIAELCQNHLGKIKNIESMVEKCAFHGADVIKLQYILSKNYKLSLFHYLQKKFPVFLN